MNIATGDNVKIAIPAETAPTASDDTQAMPMLDIYKGVSRDSEAPGESQTLWLTLRIFISNHI